MKRELDPSLRWDDVSKNNFGLKFLISAVTYSHRFGKQLAIALLHVVRLQLGFWNTPVCLFEETCTRFAHRQFQERALPVACVIIFWRLIRCNPITGIARKIFNKETTS